MEKQFRILLVDDEAELCINLCKILETHAYAVDVALTGREALALCRKTNYDIALVDIKLGAMTGTEVVEAIAQMCPATEYIYITGYASMESAIEAVQQQQVISYETKPLDLDRLLTLIKQIFKRKRAEKSIQYRLDIEKLSHAISTAFVNAEGSEIDDAIVAALEKIARFADANCSSLYILPDDLETITNTHEWCVSPQDSQIARLQDIPFSTLGYYRKELLQHKTIARSTPADLPPEAKDEREWFQQHGFRSSVCIPLLKQGRLYGALSIAGGIGKEVAWPPELIELLKSVGNLILNVLKRKQAEEQVKTALNEKEILLKEIHHRVKNNLQLISSLLSLQADYIHDEETLAIFQASQNRVLSMALVHEQLYQADDMARIDFAEYVRELTAKLFLAYDIGAAEIAVTLNIVDVAAGVDVVIHCGLILNELVSNALEHGFPNAGNGRGHTEFQSEIRIELFGADDDTFALIVANNGADFPEDVDFRNTASLGLQLVNMLVDQLHGTIELERRNGTTFTMTFPQRILSERRKLMTSTQILIVEDEYIVARDIQDRLKTLGYTAPAIVTTGEEAVRQAAKLCPDLVLMDIHLKGEMDGIAAAEQIRSHCDIPVCYLTGYSDSDTVRRASVTEPFGFILKPLRTKELRSTIEIALYKHKKDVERQHGEERLKTSIEEQDLLMRELHHQVKNNLTTLSSLLGIQSDYLDDEKSLEIFRETQNRIQSMALLHRTLYQVQNQHELDIAGYIRGLSKSLIGAYWGREDAVGLDVRVDDVSLGLKTTVPCGLIISELVTNALKYAFPLRKDGTIRVELHSVGAKGYILIVADNGIGFPPAIDFRNSPSFGLKLVNLLTRQLRGTIVLDGSAGTTVTIEFPQQKLQ
ncbi:MAG: response regulator [bacterium]|nr:response regulator [bacterium]